MARRVLALAIDWLISMAISAGFFQSHPAATLATFAVMTWLLLATRGATIGHTLTSLVVRSADGAAAGPLQVLIRTVSLCLVVPAVIWGLDGRGLHDVWAGTVIERR